MAHALPRDAAATVEITFAETQLDWPTNGAPIEIIGPEFELTRAEDENENIVPRRQAVHDLIPGLKSGSTLSHSIYMTASGVNAADQAPAVATTESDILRSALGGRTLGFRSDLDGAGTAAIPSMTADPGYVAGDWVFGYGTAGSSGRFVRIESIAGAGPYTATLLDPLPFAPTASDVLYAAISGYSDELSHDHTSANYTTLGWLIQGEDTDDVFALQGCKPAVTIEGIAAGERVTYNFEYLVAGWPDVMPAKQALAGTPSGIAPITVATGAKAQILLADFGSPLAGVDCRGTVGVELGVTWAQLMGPCAGENAEGIKGYISEITPATVTLRVAFDDPTFVAEYIAGTKKHLLIQNGDQPTNATGIYFGKLEYASRPQRVDEGGETITEIVLRALEDPADTTGLTGDDLAQRRAPFTLLHTA